MLPRITTVKPRTSYPGADMRVFDVTIVAPDHRATYTVIAPNGLIANEHASALFDGCARPLFFPEVA